MEPGMLSTLYRCLSCGISLKKSEQEGHLEQFPDHEIYRSRLNTEWEEAEKRVMLRQLEEEKVKMVKLRKAINELKKLLPKEF
jgi:hypothetical protein